MKKPVSFIGVGCSLVLSGTTAITPLRGTTAFVDAPLAASHFKVTVTPRSSTIPAKLSRHDKQVEQKASSLFGLSRLKRSRHRSWDVFKASADGSSSGNTPQPKASGAPDGPGTGVINLHFKELKAGGFKVFLFFYLLGQGRAKDNDRPFSVREIPEGIRILIGNERENAAAWDGVLDLSWGTEPQPFFRVDRIDANEVLPYPGELYILNKLLDAIIDVNSERAVGEQQKLFTFPQGESGQLSSAKAKLANMATL